MFLNLFEIFASFCHCWRLHFVFLFNCRTVTFFFFFFLTVINFTHLLEEKGRCEIWRRGVKVLGNVRDIWPDNVRMWAMVCGKRWLTRPPANTGWTSSRIHPWSFCVCLFHSAVNTLHLSTSGASLARDKSPLIGHVDAMRSWWNVLVLIRAGVGNLSPPG